MKGLFIPEITAEMFRNGCLESIEALMSEGEIYDIEYDPKQKEKKTGKWIIVEDYNGDELYKCPKCGNVFTLLAGTPEENEYYYCPTCGLYLRGLKYE